MRTPGYTLAPQPVPQKAHRIRFPQRKDAYTMRRVLVGVVALAVLLGLGTSGRAESLASARARERKLRSQLEAATAQLEATNDALEDTEARLQFDRRQLDVAGQGLAAARASLAAEVSSLYRSGGFSMVDALLDRDGQHMPQRLELVTVLLGRQADTVADAKAANAAYHQAVDQLAADQVRDRQLRADGKAELAKLNKRLAAARDLMDRLAGFPGGQAAYPEGTVAIGGHPYHCPVEPPYSFVDTFGAPRSGGRTHQGNDLMAPWGARELAFTNGVISRESSNTLGGITLYLQGDDGNEYYYAHLSRYAVPQGTRVKAGQLVSYVGQTGDARYTAPHLHFEYHPGGGSPADPYPMLKRACG
jgi:peptidoglycan LD-endopeptidase LytH